MQVCSANKIKRGEVAYVEADTQELAAIDAVYGSGAGRTSDAPLLVGSISSSIGHCGACSGLAGGQLDFSGRLGLFHGPCIAAEDLLRCIQPKRAHVKEAHA